ncbi:OmpL47-type beta-barrel domain-containing protein [Cohnella candidum]|uniref:OmpL47-type beta-barrel domain-containing protein n=1 Tax=Cohnella candidum TaxID=2674991 RepID=UPI0013DE519B|nr:PA14 domain-containing protein [Cohnella candidum]
MKFRKAISMAIITAWILSLFAASFAVREPATASAAEPEVTHGLKGEYYTNSGPPNFNFGTLKATTLDPNLDFGSLESVFQMLTGHVDLVNVRWTGSIQPDFTENYTFSMIGDNGFRLWIDNQLVIDHWVDDWDKEQVSKPISLIAGHKYDFKVEYFENWGGSNLHLSWSSPSVPKSPIPTEAFYPPEGFKHGGTVSVDGTQAEVDLGGSVNPLPVGLLQHVNVKVMGQNWPIASAALKQGDDSKLVLTFDYPVYSKDVWLVFADYDGNGGLQYADGSAVGAFSKSLVNKSTYQITTPWAEQVTKDNVLPEYPRPQLVRSRWENLNGEWEFEHAEAGEALPAGRTLNEKILVPFAAESKLSGIQRVEDEMWYKRSFTVPADWSGQRVKLNFGAVDYLATVYVNGHLAGSHKGGYTSFSFDITDYLVSGSNELIVRVTDKTDVGEDQAVGKQTVKKLGGIWYTSVSGIWQTVWLEPVSQAHIEKLDMTPDIAGGQLKLNAVAAGAEGLTVHAVAKAGGQVVGEVSGPANTELRLPVPNARLWTPDDPFLYDLEVTLQSGAVAVDNVTSYFGMREIKLGVVDGVTRPLLNGEFVFMMGPLDQGFYPDGIYTAPTDDALKFDLQTVKRVGMNTVRKHIKVEPARWYYWADKLGILVWQDMPSLEDRQGNHGTDISQAAKDQWLKEYKEMVDQLRSVPSIVEWTVFNEGWGQWDQGGPQTRDATAYVKSLDPTRLINQASGWWDAGTGDLIDMHSYPAPGSPKPTAQRAAVLGEYGGLGLHVPGHEWSPLVFSYQLMNSKEELTNRYIQFIDSLKQLKNNSGLSAAIYTQITDVEYEINGLLSYDRKVEKMDFDAIAKAHRELIGTLNIGDLDREMWIAEDLIGRAQTGDQGGQYPQAAVNAFRSAIDAAIAVRGDAQTTPAGIKSAILALTNARIAFLGQVHDPIPRSAQVDAFDSPVLNPDWTVYRPDNSKWSLSANPGHLTIQTLQGDSHEGSNNIRNVFLKNTPDGDFIVTAKISAPVGKNFQQAGLFLWQNEDNYVRFAHVWDTVGGTGKTLETAYELNGRYMKPGHAAPHPGLDTVYLQVKKEGNVYTTYFWDGAAWKQAADPVTADLKDLKIGLYAFSALDGSSITADFDYFAVAPVTPPDVTAPVTTATVQSELPQSPSGWYSSDVTLTLTASDEESGVQSTEYRTNGGDWQTYSAPVTLTSEGVTTFEYRSRDRQGNLEETKALTVSIDKTAPVLKLAVDQPVLWPPNNKPVPVHVTAEPADSGSGVDRVVLKSITTNESEQDGITKKEPDVDGAEFGTPDFIFSLLASKNKRGQERVYTITYTVTDKAGHSADASVEVRVANPSGQDR